MTSNRGQSESGRVKTRCIQSQSGRRLSWAAIHRSVAFLPQEGQARLWQELVMYLTCVQLALSQPNSFTPVIGAAGQHLCDGFHFDIAQTTGIQEGGPALVSSEQLFEWTGTETRKHGAD